MNRRQFLSVVGGLFALLRAARYSTKPTGVVYGDARVGGTVVFLNEDGSEWLDSHRFDIREVARLYNVPIELIA